MFFATTFFIGLYYYDNICKKYLTNNMPGGVLKIIGQCTLEIYLVQYAIIYYLKDIVFPINNIIISVLIFIAGWGLHILTNRIYSIAEKKIFRRIKFFESY